MDKHPRRGTVFQLHSHFITPAVPFATKSILVTVKMCIRDRATGCAIVLIGHLNKAAGTQSTYRGSVSYTHLPKLWKKRLAWDAEQRTRPHYRGKER